MIRRHRVHQSANMSQQTLAAHDAVNLKHTEPGDVDEIVDEAGQFVHPARCEACIRSKLLILIFRRSRDRDSNLTIDNCIPLIANIASISVVSAIQANEIVTADLNSTCMSILDI